MHEYQVFSIGLSLPDDLYKLAPEYEGVIDGTDREGATTIEFPGFMNMASFVQDNGLESRTRIVNTPKFYDSSTITISVAVAPW